MQTAELADKIKTKLFSMGADLVGIGDITGSEERKSISKEFHHYTRSIAIGVKLQNSGTITAFKKELNEHEQLMEYLQENEDITRLSGKMLQSATKILRKQKFRAMAIPPIHLADDKKFISTLYSLFSHRMAVTMSGMGWIGKNGMVINGEYGPNIIWSTILTDANLEPSPPQLESMCGDCSLCQAACPVNAIVGVNWSRSHGGIELVDVKACVDYMETNSEIHGRPVCGICFMACPIGYKKTRSAPGTKALSSEQNNSKR